MAQRFCKRAVDVRRRRRERGDNPEILFGCTTFVV
jgi:hypothetical protein